MKLSLFLTTILLFCFPMLYGQFGPRQVINDDPSTVRKVRTADFDNDGDLDVVASAFDLIAWYENMDGLGTFSAPNSIQEGMQISFSLFPADLDGDGNIDLVVSYFDADIVGWYRNLGDGSFGVINSIAADLQRASGVTATDLDGDDDLDLILGVSNGIGLYWVENTDGLGTFSDLITIDATLAQARTQAVGDIDGDGDLDILTNSGGGTYLSWYANLDGEGNFGNPTIIEDEPFYENAFVLADFDGDGDGDIVSDKDDLTILRKNTDGLGTFGEFTIITQEALNPSDYDSADLDNDGDLDLLSTSTTDDKIAWYENLDGNASFGPQQIIDEEISQPNTVHAADLDGDGDQDVISASFVVNRALVWYENLTILASPDVALDQVTIYPNPAKDTLTVDSPRPLDGVRLYNALGQLVLEVQKNTSDINIASLPNGVYIIELELEGVSKREKIVKE